MSSKDVIVVEREDINLPISHPGAGVAGKTGTWRTQKPVFNEEKCIKCLLCWLFCPEGTIIRTSDGKITIDYEYCKGCGICSRECPTKAIIMVEEHEG